MDERTRDWLRCVRYAVTHGLTPTDEEWAQLMVDKPWEA